MYSKSFKFLPLLCYIVTSIVQVLDSFHLRHEVQIHLKVARFKCWITLAPQSTILWKQSILGIKISDIVLIVQEPLVSQLSSLKCHIYSKNIRSLLQIVGIPFFFYGRAGVLDFLEVTSCLDRVCSLLFSFLFSFFTFFKNRLSGHKSSHPMSFPYLSFLHPSIQLSFYILHTSPWTRVNDKHAQTLEFLKGVAYKLCTIYLLRNTCFVNIIFCTMAGARFQ